VGVRGALVETLHVRTAETSLLHRRSKGAELGVGSVPFPHWQTTLSLWQLALDSALVFLGDAGTTEASRPSRRTGVEWANYFRPVRR